MSLLMPKYDYLKTEHWLKFRKEVRKLRKVCEICGSNKKLNVHHRNYKNVGRENFGDVYLVCNYHHKKLHRIAKQKKISYDKAFNELKENNDCPSVRPVRRPKKVKIGTKRERHQRHLDKIYGMKAIISRDRKEERARINALKAERLKKLSY